MPAVLFAIAPANPPASPVIVERASITHPANLVFTVFSLVAPKWEQVTLAVPRGRHGFKGGVVANTAVALGSEAAAGTDLATGVYASRFILIGRK